MTDSDEHQLKRELKVTGGLCWPGSDSWRISCPARCWSGSTGVGIQVAAGQLPDMLGSVLRAAATPPGLAARPFGGD